MGGSGWAKISAPAINKRKPAPSTRDRLNILSRYFTKLIEKLFISYYNR
jgi:hypothetical protein